jgi:hypothetical protein
MISLLPSVAKAAIMNGDDGTGNGFVSLYPVFVVSTQRFTLDVFLLIACAHAGCAQTAWNVFFGIDRDLRVLRMRLRNDLFVKSHARRTRAICFPPPIVPLQHVPATLHWQAVCGQAFILSCFDALFEMHADPVSGIRSPTCVFSLGYPCMLCSTFHSLNDLLARQSQHRTGR